MTYKCRITKIGSFDSYGFPIDWVFNGDCHPDSIANTLTANGCQLWGGYTLNELKEIKLADEENPTLAIAFEEWLYKQEEAMKNELMRPIFESAFTAGVVACDKNWTRKIDEKIKND